MAPTGESTEQPFGLVRLIGLVAGGAIFALLLALPTLETFHVAARVVVQETSSSIPETALASSMQSVTALLLLMVIWWVTEAIPLPVTALLPALVLPALRVTGTAAGAPVDFNFRNVLVGYASPVIYLFLGGFLLAAAMQKRGLDRRLTLWLLSRGRLAESPRAILLGIMGTTAFISMWISNTATAAMMLPLGLGLLTLIGQPAGQSRYGTALMLGIAWAASIGGIGTIIGTPPNGIALGILNSSLSSEPAAHRVTFLEWMITAVPVVLLMVPAAWGVLLLTCRPDVRTIPGGRARILAERDSLGPVDRGTRRTILMFVLVVTLWISNPFWDAILPSWLSRQLAWVDEYWIGLFAGLSLFVIPVDLKRNEFIISWADTKFVDWGTLVLFGGGIALSDAMFKTGLASWIASGFMGLLGTPSFPLLLFGTVLLMGILTEVTSNTAVTGMMVPIIISIARTTGNEPTTLVIGAAIGSSLAFMLPVATPPNALVFGTHYVSLRDMIRSGILLEIIGWLVVAGVMLLLRS